MIGCGGTMPRRRSTRRCEYFSRRAQATPQLWGWCARPLQSEVTRESYDRQASETLVQCDVHVGPYRLSESPRGGRGHSPHRQSRSVSSPMANTANRSPRIAGSPAAVREGVGTTGASTHAVCVLIPPTTVDSPRTGAPSNSWDHRSSAPCPTWCRACRRNGSD